MKQKLRLSLAIAVVALALNAVACGGGGKTSATTPVSVATRPSTQVSATVSGAAPTSTPGTTPSPAASVPPDPSPTAANQTTAGPTAPNPGSGTAAVPQPTAVPRASAVSLTFRAADLAFDKTAVRVPVGATITATLQNDDIGQEHNLTFGLPGLPHGDTCKGPCTATQVFKVETSGSYSFLCTIHDMFGTFTVDP